MTEWEQVEGEPSVRFAPRVLTGRYHRYAVEGWEALVQKTGLVWRWRVAGPTGGGHTEAKRTHGVTELVAMGWDGRSEEEAKRTATAVIDLLRDNARLLTPPASP